MTIDECYQLGYVMKTHGTKGEITIFLDVDDPAEYKAIESVLVEINQQLVPFIVQRIGVQQDKAIVKFEDIDTIEKAEQLKGCALYLPLKSLPDLEDDQFYFHEIIDYTVVDKQLGVLGKVSNVYNLPHQDLIAMIYQQKEVLIPISDEIVVGVDREKHEVAVDLPEGLLDVYLNE